MSNDEAPHQPVGAELARPVGDAPPVSRGLLFVVSAPSGAGKTTLVDRLVTRMPGLTISRSYTSRGARAGERDGVDYNFVTRTRFEAMIAAGDFLEWAELFGNLYGTRRSDTEQLQTSGVDVVLVIDVQGTRWVRKHGLGAASVFVMPPSFIVLEERLRRRSKDSEDAIQRRLQVAREEVAAFVEYDFVVVNDELDAASDRLQAIFTAERSSLERMRGEAETIVKTFGK